MKYKVKDINRLVYPILLNYLLNSIFEILDQAIVGHYSSQSFALVGIASSMIYAVTGAFGIMSTVFNIIAAERKGKKDEAGFESVFAINKMLTLLIGFLFFIIGCLGGKLFFRQVYGITGNDLIEMLSYFYPAAFTVVQNMLIFQYSAYYRNCFNTKITLYSTIVSTIVNLFFDYSLVFGCFGLPQLGTAGAAWGSVIGLFVGLFIYQIPYWRKHSPVIAKRMIEKNTIKQMFRLYPSFWGQEFLENTILVFVVSGIVSRMGTDKMAVYSLLGTVGGIVGLPVYAYAIAAQTYALQKRASGNKDEAKELLGAMTLSEEGTLAIWDSIKSYPINTKAMESDKLQSENAFFGPSLVEAEKTAIENLNIFQYTPKAMAESDIVVPYFTKAVNGEISIDDALAMAQEDLEVQLGNAYD